MIDRSDWAARCLKRMVEIKPDIDLGAADRMALAMWSLDRLRDMGPGAVAELLLSDPVTRPG
ncbi:MAG TPA: hypothetical protein VGP22_02935 [Albitalea sp.]|nr:hypothetical protein [Albitalea sp.]